MKTSKSVNVCFISIFCASIGLQVVCSTYLDQCTSEIKPILRLLALLSKRDSSKRPRTTTAAARAELVLPAMDLAIEQISNSNLLPYHTLEIVYKDSGCDVTETVVGLTSGLFPSDESGGVVGIIGPTDTMDSRLVSSITNRPELQITALHGAGSSFLANRTMFPNALSMVGSIQSLVDLSLALMKKSGWNKIAILYENSHRFYHSMKEQFIASVGKTCILYISDVTHNFYPLQDIPPSKARVVFLFSSPEHSRRIMCLAYHMKLVYPRYQWVLMGQQLTNFKFKDKHVKVNYQKGETTCSPTILTTVALEKAFMLNYQSSMDLHSKHEFTNLSLGEFQDLHYNRMVTLNHSIDDSKTPINWGYVMYDAVWTWALVLDKLLTSNRTKEYYSCSYKDKQWVKKILEEFYSVYFQGMSGHISFNTTNGFLNRPVHLFFVADGREKLVATYASNSTIVTWLQHTETIPDIVRIVGLPHKAIVGFFLTTICTIFVVIVLLHTLTLLYRNSKHIKASSLKLIQVAFLGGYILILAMLLYNLQRIKVFSSTEGTIICRLLWMWSFPLGFTMPVGIVIVRTWRIYRIFKHYLNPGKFLSNSALLMILLVLVLIDITHATIWTAVDPMQFEFIEYSGPANELLVDQSCVANNIYVWMGIGFTYKIVLLLTMIILSIITRDIPNQTFETSSLRAFSYLFSTVYIIGLCLYYFFRLFDSNVHGSIADYVILCLVFNIVIVIYLVFIVIPPIFPVLRNTVRRKMSDLAANSYQDI